MTAMIIVTDRDTCRDLASHLARVWDGVRPDRCHRTRTVAATGDERAVDLACIVALARMRGAEVAS